MGLPLRCWEEICDAVYKTTGIHQKFLLLKSGELGARKREIVNARFMAMTAIKHNTGSSLEEIGELFSGRKYWTVLHAIKKNKHFCETEKPYKTVYESLENKVAIIIGKYFDEKEDKLQDIIINFKDELNYKQRVTFNKICIQLIKRGI